MDGDEEQTIADHCVSDKENRHIGRIETAPHNASVSEGHSRHGRLATSREEPGESGASVGRAGKQPLALPPAFRVSTCEEPFLPPSHFYIESALKHYFEDFLKSIKQCTYIITYSVSVSGACYVSWHKAVLELTVATKLHPQLQTGAALWGDGAPLLPWPTPGCSSAWSFGVRSHSCSHTVEEEEKWAWCGD